MAYMKIKKSKKQPKQILLNPAYPIGHATGLSAEEWQEFANEYIPFSER